MASNTSRAFAIVSQLPLPETFCLAGGTALALQIGHRISYDLDFFSFQNQLDSAERAALSRQLQNLDATEIKHETNSQLYTTIQGVEVSFLYQQHPLLFPTRNVQGIHLAHPVDIGLMKLAAIKDRGARRDFVDVYCLRDIAPLSMLFDLLPQKYFDRPDFSVHLAYALSYFDDAETDPQQLNMLRVADWAQVKMYCLEGARSLSKINAGLEPPA